MQYDSIVVTLYKGRYNVGGEAESIRYRTFGEFDYLEIADADIFSGEKVADYSKFWKKTMETSKALKTGESCHNLYAVSVNKGENAKFWESSEPYLFVSLMQIKKGKDNETDLSEMTKALKEYLEEKSK